MSEGRNPTLVKIYSVIGIAIVCLCTWATIKLIIFIWYPPFFDVKPAVVNPKVAEMKALAAGIQPKDFTVAYRSPGAMSENDRFHGVVAPDNKDKIDYCQTCHGEIPHIKSVRDRSFLNTHASQLACETCHIEGQGNPTFKWYNLSTGEYSDKIAITDVLLHPDYKIIAIYGYKGEKSYENIQKIADANALLGNAANLSNNERKEQIKPFHKNLRESDKVVKCPDCHVASGESFVPLAKLGYPVGRIEALMTSEIIGMLNKYKEFYLPAFLYNKNVDRGSMVNVPFEDEKGQAVK